MKKGSLGGPGSPVWLGSCVEPRIALVGNPAGYPMLFGRNCHFWRIYRAESSAEFARMECDAAIGKREQRVIFADADIAARIEFRPALTHEDVACGHFLTTEFLHAETATGRVTTVAR